MRKPSVRSSFTTGLVAALTIASAFAQAQSAPNFKPGLWEESVERVIGGGAEDPAVKAAQAALANMSPEQRKMMERMMREQGIALQVGAGGMKVTSRGCLAPGKSKFSAISGLPEGCTQRYTRKGEAWEVTARCEAREGQPASEMRGTLTMLGSTGHRGDFSGGNAQQGTARMKTEGRWLSADCGSVKPG
jgi:hypothetical protein